MLLACLYILSQFQSCSESITSIQGGAIRNYGIPEIIVTTFTGEIK